MTDIPTQWTKRDYTISMAKASWFSLVAAGPILLALGLLYVAVWGTDPLVNATAGYFNLADESMGLYFGGLLLFLLIFAVGIVVHEALHGITWKLAGGKPWSAIAYGFQISTFTPYSHCREPLPIQAYRLGTFMPGLVTGILPMLLGILTGSAAALLLGGLFVLAAGGDLVILFLIRACPRHALVEDHPSLAGCWVYEPAASSRPD